MTNTLADNRPIENDDPLIVDLDGTLIRSNLLVESAFAWLGAKPQRFLTAFFLLARGRAALEAAIAAETPLDVERLPYNENVRALIDEARRDGRRVYIASAASNERQVAAIARHVGADGWVASDATTNLSEAANERRLVAGSDVQVASGRVKAWIKLLRPHQWAKNLLVFVPMLTSHTFDLASVVASLTAFVAFSLAASAIYIINDLVDLEADRRHPTKCRRPLAAGTVPILASLPVAGAAVAASLALAMSLSLPFTAALAGYLLLTTAYTFSLKRKMLIDVVVLSGLYTLRVLGGAAAIAVPLSPWLLGFSMFIFTSLALIKRYVELTARIDGDLPDATNRNYRKSDLNIVASLAAASGFNAVTVFALYVSSDNVRLLYDSPDFLWLICPILMYWIGRMIIMAQRRYVDDDPVLFAIQDRNSWLAFGLIGAILALAA